MKERHLEGRRRAQFDRRSGKERRRGFERRLIPSSAATLESIEDRRKGQRRSGKDRRAS
ncbi:MAG: hypothetical protein ACYTA3_14825 [Planctomycetota bacterium]|jgi:hypothetical protein